VVNTSPEEVTFETSLWTEALFLSAFLPWKIIFFFILLVNLLTCDNFSVYLPNF
jgi:hypothetical protein